MEVPFDVFDSLAGAEISAGEQVLSGPDALAFARARHALPSGDFGRSENQGRLMVAAIAQFRREFSKDPSRLLTWIGAGLRNAQTDVPLDALMTLAFTASTINPKRIVNVVLPGSVGMSGTTSIVSLNQTTLDAISGDLANDGLLKKANVPPSPNADLVGSEA
jgi:polyisoprenyl-teichoic acid--peptidoglycan teichoic acid transferase